MQSPEQSGTTPFTVSSGTSTGRWRSAGAAPAEAVGAMSVHSSSPPRRVSSSTSSSGRSGGGRTRSSRRRGRPGRDTAASSSRAPATASAGGAGPDGRLPGSSSQQLVFGPASRSARGAHQGEGIGGPSFAEAIVNFNRAPEPGASGSGPVRSSTSRARSGAPRPALTSANLDTHTRAHSGAPPYERRRVPPTTRSFATSSMQSALDRALFSGAQSAAGSFARGGAPSRVSEASEPQGTVRSGRPISTVETEASVAASVRSAVAGVVSQVISQVNHSLHPPPAQRFCGPKCRSCGSCC